MPGKQYLFVEVEGLHAEHDFPGMYFFNVAQLVSRVADLMDAVWQDPPAFEHAAAQVAPCAPKIHRTVRLCTYISVDKIEQTS